MERMGPMSAASIPRPGRAARARSANRAMAPKLASPAREGTSSGPGKLSEGTRQVTSPGTPRPCPAGRQDAQARAAAEQPGGQQRGRGQQVLAVVQHEQPALRQSTRVRRCARSAPARCSTPAARATAAQTRSGSGTPLRSTRFTPSANRGAAAAATSSASRVLPTPPAPTRVTSRFPASCPVTSVTSRSRPITGVSGSGKPGGHARPWRTGHPFPTAEPPSVRYRDHRAQHQGPEQLPSAVKAPEQRRAPGAAESRPATDNVFRPCARQ